jgi:peptide/nickel transport system substrate-binding protein
MIHSRIRRRDFLTLILSAPAIMVAACAPAPPSGQATPKPAGQAAAPAATAAPAVQAQTAAAATPATQAAQPAAKPDQEKYGGTMVMALQGASDIKNFNQAIFYDSASWFVSTSVFARLVTMDYGPTFDIHPQLAEKWTVAPDAKTYTFNLVKNAKWHDGKPLTADDIKFTYLGVVEQNGPAASFLKSIDSIDTPDPYTVKINLKQPDAAFLYGIGVYPRLPILPKHLYENTKWLDNPNNMKPVGSGPFKFQEYVPGDHITLVANDDYFGGRPYLDRVIWKLIPDERAAIAAFQAGEYAALNNPPPLALIADMQKQPNVVVDTPAGPWGFYIGFNMTHKPLDNPDVRQAIAYAIDKKDATQKVTGGIAPVSEGVYTKGIAWAWNPNVKVPEYNTTKAEEMLDAAGLKRGSDGTRFRMNLTLISQDVYPLLGDVLKEQLGKVGIGVDIKVLDNPTFNTAMPKLEHDAMVYALWIGPDPNEWKQQLETNGFRNWFGYSNPEVEQLFVQGASTPDREKRKDAYFKIQEIVAKDLPRINIFDAPYSFAHSTQYKGWFSEEGTISYRMDLAKVYKVK